jgi:hypothetical protein
METVVYVVELREMVKDRAILQNAVEQIRRVVATEFEVRGPSSNRPGTYT